MGQKHYTLRNFVAWGIKMQPVLKRLIDYYWFYVIIDKHVFFYTEKATESDSNTEAKLATIIEEKTADSLNLQNQEKAPEPQESKPEWPWHVLDTSCYRSCDYMDLCYLTSYADEETLTLNYVLHLFDIKCMWSAVQ